MFGLGYAELIIVGIVAVILFGGRLPEVARSMGRSLTEFKKGMSDIENDVSDAIYSDPASAATGDEYHSPSAPKFIPPTSPPRMESEV